MTDIPREPCPDWTCAGHEEIARLMRGMGPIFEGRTDGVIGGLVRALGIWKNRINAALCREWAEGDPCTAHRLLPLHARRWAFPVDCVPLSAETLCAWIALVKRCRPGSVGFIRAALDFVLPGKPIQLVWQKVDGKPYWQSSQRRACENRLIIVAPPACFAYAEECRDVLGHVQDGTRPERRYFIPEVECLRAAALPIGLSIGYQTDPIGPQGEDIWNVPETALIPAPPRAIPLICCEKDD